MAIGRLWRTRVARFVRRPPERREAEARPSSVRCAPGSTTACGDAQTEGVIRLVHLVRRRPDLDAATFGARLLDDHGPLLASLRLALGIVRATIAVRTGDPADERMAQARGGMEEPYDAVIEVWFRSEAELLDRLGTERGRSASSGLVGSERTFSDLATSPMFLAHEYPQVNPTPESIVAHPNSGLAKLHFPLRHVHAMTPTDAQTYWHTMHGPLIRSMAPGMGILRYQQVHRFPSTIETMMRADRGVVVDPYLGHAEVWSDRGAARSGEVAARGGRRAIEDESRFIDFRRSAIWFGAEHLLIDGHL